MKLKVTRHGLISGICALIWVSVLPGRDVLACSAIAGSPDGAALLGGNYDWHTRGGIAFESPRHQIKSAPQSRKQVVPLSWTSRYASLTVSQFGRDFPMQGINEVGLAGMVLMGQAQYPAAGPLGTIPEYLWLQYQLDQYGTVADVAAHASDLGIEKVSASLHWFMCDASNDCAVIDFTDGKANVHRDADLTIRALTNTSYRRAIQSYARWKEAQYPLPQGYESHARFVRLAEMSNLRDGLRLNVALDEVSLRGFTAWQTIFDLDARSLSVRLEGDSWRTLSFDDHQMSCDQPLKMMNLRTGLWTTYDHDQVAQLFAEAAERTTGLGPESRARILRTSESVQCDKVSEAR